MPGKIAAPEEHGCQEPPPTVVLSVVLERVLDDADIDEAANLEVNLTNHVFRQQSQKDIYVRIFI